MKICLVAPYTPRYIYESNRKTGGGGGGFVGCDSAILYNDKVTIIPGVNVEADSCRSLPRTERRCSLCLAHPAVMPAIYGRCGFEEHDDRRWKCRKRQVQRLRKHEVP